MTRFIEKDTDLLVVDATFVSLLHHLSNSFVDKLVSGLSLAMENHSKDESITVQAQVGLHSLRQPTPILSPDSLLSWSVGDNEQP